MIEVDQMTYIYFRDCIWQDALTNTNMNDICCSCCSSNPYVPRKYTIRNHYDVFYTMIELN